MISYLNGKVLNKGANFVVLLVGGVGYKVFMEPSRCIDIEAEQELALYTHQHVREDMLDLYGFRSMEELEMFELLLTISGVGPKSALGVIAIASVTDLKDSIARGDSSLLVKVSGIGKKTAERVVLELRDKVDSLVSGDYLASGNQVDSNSSDEIDALLALGYSSQQARDALKKVNPDVSDSGERIRAALRNI
jgi:Holliday junction DNA helicase RuvA